jgi:hypothetical protein
MGNCCRYVLVVVCLQKITIIVSIRLREDHRESFRQTGNDFTVSRARSTLLHLKNEIPNPMSMVQVQLHVIQEVLKCLEH